MQTNFRHNPAFRLISRWGPPVVVMAAIFTFSSLPTLPQIGTPWWNVVVKKAGHLLGYALLYASWYRALAYESSLLHNTAALLAIGLSLVYALTDEYHQSFVIGRHPSLTDVFVDSVGVMAAYLTGQFGLVRYTKSTSNK